MADVSKDKSFDEILREVGPDATAMFDNTASNPTEHASSEATNAATAVNGRGADKDEGDDEDEKLEDEDDDAAEEEEIDEELEKENIDEAAL
jgi:hypothetical protein